MNEDGDCQKLCAVDFEAEDVKNFAWMIEREYYANLYNSPFSKNLSYL